MHFREIQLLSSVFFVFEMIGYSQVGNNLSPKSGVGVFGWQLGTPTSFSNCENFLTNRDTPLSRIVIFTYYYGRTPVCPGERRNAMTAKEELLSFIENLTDDEVEKLFNLFLEQPSSAEESCPPCLQESPLQTA